MLSAVALGIGLSKRGSSQPARVYRGVRESDMQLPPEFLQCEEGKFAGGVERAFMSTTKSPEVAFVRQPRLRRCVFVRCVKTSVVFRQDYSGGGTTVGSLLVIDFDLGESA